MSWGCFGAELKLDYCLEPEQWDKTMEFKDVSVAEEFNLTVIDHDAAGADAIEACCYDDVVGHPNAGTATGFVPGTAGADASDATSTVGASSLTTSVSRRSGLPTAADAGRRTGGPSAPDSRRARLAARAASSASGDAFLRDVESSFLASRPPRPPRPRGVLGPVASSSPSAASASSATAVHILRAATRPGWRRAW